MNSREGLHLGADSFVLERKELETVLDSGIFAPSSNAAKLVRYVCERHFNHTADSITEHDVAIQALGRRPDFDPQRDSIVRVEAHRVRKRLQEYYESEGTAHPVKIVLSRGQYAPRFTYADTEELSEPPTSLEAEPAPVAMPPSWQDVPNPSAPARFRAHRALVLAFAAILVVALAAGSLWLRSSGEKQVAVRPGAPLGSRRPPRAEGSSFAPQRQPLSQGLRMRRRAVLFRCANRW